MKEGWEYKKFKDICYSISDGDWIERKDQSNAGIRLVQTGNIGIGKFIPKDDSQKFITADTFKRLRCCEIFEGDILISRLPNPLGRSCILPKMDTRCITAVDCSILKLKKEIVLPMYFVYYTQSSGYFSKIDSESSGTTRARITRKKLEETGIPIPPLSEQQSIVAYLDSAFAKIDTMKANAEKALNEAQALFQASLKEMLEPKEGWEEKTLGEILNLRRGHDLTHSQMKGSDYPVAGSNGQIGTHNCCTPISPCITVGRSGSVGAVNIYKECWAHNTTLYIDDFKGNYPKYLYYLLLSIDLAHLNSGSAVPTLNRNFIHPLAVPFVKNNNEQQSIVAILDTLKSKVDRLQANYDKISQECYALKQSILRQVFE